MILQKRSCLPALVSRSLIEAVMIDCVTETISFGGGMNYKFLLASHMIMIQRAEKQCSPNFKFANKKEEKHLEGK